MNYQKVNEEPFNTFIDCYWESHELENGKKLTYPSLPEPYINLFFPIHYTTEATIKGISSKTDIFKMKSKLFGVKIFLRGYFQLHLSPCSEITNKIVSLSNIGGTMEAKLTAALSRADNFKERIIIFKLYFEQKLKQPIQKLEVNISNAFQYLITHYNDPKIIQNYADLTGNSPRTIHRWFSEEIGITPKKLCRIERFHNALYYLHSNEGAGFYLDCGYYDQAHYIKDFKEFTGMTPEDYMKQVLNHSKANQLNVSD